MANNIFESQIPKEQLLSEIEELIRIAPLKESIGYPSNENFSWLGRVAAVINVWDPPKSIPLEMHLFQLLKARHFYVIEEEFSGIMIMLHRARSDLRLTTLGPLSVAIGAGQPYDYFDEIRKVLETARQDVFFIDPYLDSEFVSRYLGQIAKGSSIRLLTAKKLSSLLPAVDAFCKQSKGQIEVRSDPNFHDRYLFIDKQLCFQSGASFKDGAMKNPTTLTQITDAFSSVLQTYETIWNGAKHEG